MKIVMTSSALCLEPFAPQHFPSLATWFTSERDLVQWGGPVLSFPLDDAQMQEMVDQGTGTQPDRLCWMIMARDELIGHAQLAYDWRNGVTRLSRVAVAPNARGRGLAAPMLKLVVDKGFSRPEIERLDLYVFDWNAPAIRTYERLGFVYEGTERSVVRVGDERWDMRIMSILRTEWIDRTGA